MRTIGLPAALVVLAVVAVHTPELWAQARPRSNEGMTRPTPPGPTTPAQSPPAPPRGATLNDAQILTIALTLHQLDIVRSKLAQKRAASPQVSQFATQLVNEHTQGQKSSMDLAKQLNLKLEDSDVTKELKAWSADKDALLKKLALASARSDFDKAYVDSEVEYHQKILDTLGAAPVGTVQAASLKTGLQTTRSTAAAQLARAKQMQVWQTGAK